MTILSLTLRESGTLCLPTFTQSKERNLSEAKTTLWKAKVLTVKDNLLYLTNT